MSVFSVMKGQDGDVLLDKIDFNDTTLIDRDFMKRTLAEYLTSKQDTAQSQRVQMYAMILASDNILNRSCTSYAMYKSVYQYLMYGFSEMGANMVVDYLMSLPYFEFVDADDNQKKEILEIAKSYDRVRIGAEAPDIQAVAINGKDFSLRGVDSRYTLLFFWSYSCPHCREMIGELGDFAPQNSDVAIVTINISGDLKKIKRLLKKTHLEKCYNIFDGEGWNSRIVENYAVNMTPAFFLLDEDKKIIAKPFDIQELINEIER